MIVGGAVKSLMEAGIEGVSGVFKVGVEGVGIAVVPFVFTARYAYAFKPKQGIVDGAFEALLKGHSEVGSVHPVGALELIRGRDLAGYVGRESIAVTLVKDVTSVTPCGLCPVH